METETAGMAALDSTQNTFPPLFDVGAVWTRLWHRRLTVLACVVAGLALALVYLAVTTPIYTATASLLVDPRTARSAQFEAVLPGIGADSAAVASQVFVIESRDLLMAVFESEGIEHDTEFASGGLFSLLTASSRAEKDVVFRRFERRVSVERAGLTYVIEVSFKSESADKAARIANAIVNRYKAGLVGDRESANSDVNARLTERIVALQANVAEADRAVGDFKVQHDILDPNAGGTLQSQIDQLTTQAIEARASADQAKGKYDQAVAAGVSPAGLAKLSEIVSSPTIDRLRADYNERAAGLANAEAIYQSRHPAVRRLRSELSRTSALLATEAERVTRELKAKYELSVKGVAALDAKLAVSRGKSQAAEAAQIELRRLKAKAEAARTVLDEVLKRAEETAQMRGLQLAEAKVIGVAAPPVQPTWPTPMLLLPVSAALGFLIGCGLAVADGSPDRDRAVALTGAPARQVDHRTAISSGEPVPAYLGRYALPGQFGSGASSRIRAMRRRFLQRGGEAFSQNTLKLVRAIIARLTEHPAPYLLLVSSVRSPAEAKLAGAMIGIGLQQAGQNVLVVEFSGQPRPRELNAGVFINGASGLPTIVRPLPAGENSGAFVLGQDLAGDFDFVLLLGPPLIDPDWHAARFGQTDLLLFALAAAENAVQAIDLLRQRLSATDISRSATLIIATEAAPLQGEAS